MQRRPRQYRRRQAPLPYGYYGRLAGLAGAVGYAGYNYLAGSPAATATPLAIVPAKKTKTKSKTKSKTSSTFTTKDDYLTGQNVCSNFVHRLKEQWSEKVLSKNSPPQTWISNYTGRVTFADGRQGAYTFLYYDSVPMTGQLQLLPAVNPAGNTSRRMYLSSCNAELTLSNSSNSTAYVHILDIAYKRDIESAATDADCYNPQVAWQTGEVEQGNADGITLIGTHPKSVDKFNQYYNILGHSKHFMGVGDVHKHKVGLYLNKFISENLISEKIGYRGYTFATLIYAYGVPVNNDDVTPVVTTSSGAIDCVMTEKCVFRWQEDLDYDTVIGSKLQTGVVGLEVVEDDGDINPLANA